MIPGIANAIITTPKTSRRRTPVTYLSQYAAMKPKVSDIAAAASAINKLFVAYFQKPSPKGGPRNAKARFSWSCTQPTFVPQTSEPRSLAAPRQMIARVPTESTSHPSKAPVDKGRVISDPGSRRATERDSPIRIPTASPSGSCSLARCHRTRTTMMGPVMAQATKVAAEANSRSRRTKACR